MAFSYRNSRGKTYFLHSKVVTLKGGRKQPIFYFAKVAGVGAQNEVPAAYKVIESARTGLPILKKK